MGLEVVIYNSIRNLGEMWVYLSYSKVWQLDFVSSTIALLKNVGFQLSVSSAVAFHMLSLDITNLRGL